MFLQLCDFTSTIWNEWSVCPYFGCPSDGYVINKLKIWNKKGKAKWPHCPYPSLGSSSSEIRPGLHQAQASGASSRVRSAPRRRLCTRRRPRGAAAAPGRGGACAGGGHGLSSCTCRATAVPGRGSRSAQAAPPAVSLFQHHEFAQVTEDDDDGDENDGDRDGDEFA